MTRNAILTALAMGVSAAVAGYIWVGFEFPFAVLLPAVVGILAASWAGYSPRRALMASLLGGAGFTAAFILVLFLALTDGSPVSLPAWAGALLAGAVAGAISGAILEGRAGVLPMAAYSAVGMTLGVAAAAALRAVAPAAVDTEGFAQTAFVAITLGVVGLLVGAFVGLGVQRLGHGDTPARPAGAAGPTASAR